MSGVQETDEYAGVSSSPQMNVRIVSSALRYAYTSQRVGQINESMPVNSYSNDGDADDTDASVCLPREVDESDAQGYDEDVWVLSAVVRRLRVTTGKGRCRPT